MTYGDRWNEKTKVAHKVPPYEKPVQAACNPNPSSLKRAKNLSYLQGLNRNPSNTKRPEREKLYDLPAFEGFKEIFKAVDFNLVYAP